MPLVGPVETAGFSTIALPIPIPPVPPPPIPPGVLTTLEILRAELPNEDDERLKWQIPYYPPIVPPPPVNPAYISQKVFGHSGAGGGYLTLPNPVTIGHLLIFVGSVAGGLDIPPPNTSPAQPRFGAGAWTRFSPSQLVYYAYGTPGGGGNAMYYKIADSTSNYGYIGINGGAYGIYEIANGDINTLAFIFKTQQASTPTMQIGNLGSGAGTITIQIGTWADTDAGSPFNPPTWTPGTGWGTDQLYWIPGTGGRWGPPVTWIASGNSSLASGTRGPLSGFANGSWSGVAVCVSAIP